MIPETAKETPEGGLSIRDLLASLESGCVYHDKRWSGDTHADLGGTINESATDAVMRDAHSLILLWLPSVILQKRAALRVMERDAMRQMMSGKHGWSDMDAKAAIKTMRAEIASLRSLANDERMRPYQRGRASITGLVLKIRKIMATGRLVGVA